MNIDKKAKKLLASNVLSILDIAMELNFGSSQYFSHLFKKLTGLTPSEYRKNHYQQASSVPDEY